MRRVRCVDCGFLNLSWDFQSLQGRQSGQKALDLADRDDLRSGLGVKRAEQVRCSLNVIDLQKNARTAFHTDSSGSRLKPGYAAPVAADAASERICPHFYAYRPGFDAREHLDLQRGDQKTSSDRRWDLIKIGGGFLLGVATTVLGLIAKTWIDYLQALPPPP